MSLCHTAQALSLSMSSQILAGSSSTAKYEELAFGVSKKWRRRENYMYIVCFQHVLMPYQPAKCHAHLHVSPLNHLT